MSDIEQTVRLFSAAERRRLHLPGRGHKVLADPEVRAFVDASLETMTFTAIAKVCRERFGTRAPSRSSLHRYWLALLGSRSPDLPRLSREIRRGTKGRKP